jgi:hypothetical protein
MLQKPQTSTNPSSRARRAVKKGKRRAIVLSDDDESYRAHTPIQKGKGKAIVLSDDEVCRAPHDAIVSLLTICIRLLIMVRTLPPVETALRLVIYVILQRLP